MRRLCTILLIPVAGLCVLWAIFVLVFCATWTCRALAIGFGIASVDLILLIPFGLPWKYGSARRAAWFATFAASLLLLAIPTLSAPPGEGGDDHLTVEHVFLKPGVGFPRYSIPNIVPEADQVTVGLAVAKLIRRPVSAIKPKRLSRLILYEKMAADPAFRDMGSVLKWAFADDMGLPFDVGHYVAIVPRRAASPVPLLVFLHGRGGNFSRYWHSLSPLARDHGIAVIAPSFGDGFWDRPGGVEDIRAAIEDACKRFPIDGKRIFIAGLSNGGKGALRYAIDYPGSVKGIVLISAVLDQEPIQRGIDKGTWKGLPMFFIHGQADWGVPFSVMKPRFDRMVEAGALPSTLVFADADHFLFFSKHDEVIDGIAAWMEALLGNS